MERGKITWIDKIIILRDEVSKKPKVTCEGLWSGLDRRMIGRMLLKAMRKSSNETKKLVREAKKAEKKEEESKNVRGQRKSTK